MDASSANADPAWSPNATLLKFGYPGTLIHRGHHWAVLARPAQPTLGSLVLCSLGDQCSLADMPRDAFVEFGLLVKPIEKLLKTVADAEKINYLMLMMVDPHVHYHVLPRYAGSRSFGGQDYVDRGWPALPDLKEAVALGEDLTSYLRACWA